MRGGGFDGDPFEFIALRHQRAGIQRWFDFYCRYADEGEDTGASAKVYILHDTSLRIFIEVTDKELVDPTAEQQVEPTNGYTVVCLGGAFFLNQKRVI